VEEAIAALRQAISLDAGHTKAHVLLGQFLTARGEHRAAWREFDAVLALQPEGSEAETAREGLRELNSLHS
jgi:cytochrome c-type biogenesis protein CcmH/NrfG